MDRKFCTRHDLSVLMWRHSGHVGVQNSSEKNLLGTCFYYYATLERHFAIVLYTNMAVSSHEWKPRIIGALIPQNDEKNSFVRIVYEKWIIIMNQIFCITRIQPTRAEIIWRLTFESIYLFVLFIYLFILFLGDQILNCFLWSSSYRQYY